MPDARSSIAPPSPFDNVATPVVVAVSCLAGINQGPFGIKVLAGRHLEIGLVESGPNWIHNSIVIAVNVGVITGPVAIRIKPFSRICRKCVTAIRHAIAIFVCVKPIIDAIAVDIGRFRASIRKRIIGVTYAIAIIVATGRDGCKVGR